MRLLTNKEMAEAFGGYDFRTDDMRAVCLAQVKAVREEIGKLRHIPQKYHYVCWASGTLVVKDKWGDSEYYQCPSFNGDFNCGHRGCKDGLIKGVKEVTDYEKHQNWLLDKILAMLTETSMSSQKEGQ